MTSDPNQAAEEAAVDAGLTGRPVSVSQLSTTIKTALGYVFTSILAVGATVATLQTQVSNIGASSTDASKLTMGVLSAARLPNAAGDTAGPYGALVTSKIKGQTPPLPLNLMDYPIGSPSADPTGSADSSTALAAWASALAGYAAAHSGAGPQGYAPCGIFKFSSPVTFALVKLTLLGQGACTEFHYTGPAGTTAFNLQMPTAYTTGAGLGTVMLADFRLHRDTADSSGGIGIHVVNPTSFRMVRVDVDQFDRQVVQEGGDNNHYVTNNLRSGDLQTSFQPGSGLLDLEPFVWTSAGGVTTTVCPNSTYISDHNFGGPNTQFGLKIACADGVYTGTGHIGAGLVNDVEIDRIKGQGAQSIDIGGADGYLDNAQRAVYIGPPTGSGDDSKGAGAYAIRIHPFQIANTTGNAIEVQDPTADVGVFDTHIFNISGWAVYAPNGNRFQIKGNELYNVATNAALKAGAFEFGVVQTGAAGVGSNGGTVNYVAVKMNELGTTAACFFASGTVTTSQLLGNGFMPGGCTAGKPIDSIPGNLTVANQFSALNATLTGTMQAPTFTGTNMTLTGTMQAPTANVTGNLTVPNGSGTFAGNVASNTYSAGGANAPGVSCTGVPTSSAVWTNGIRTTC